MTKTLKKIIAILILSQVCPILGMMIGFMKTQDNHHIIIGYQAGLILDGGIAIGVPLLYGAFRLADWIIDVLTD